MGMNSKWAWVRGGLAVIVVTAFVGNALADLDVKDGNGLPKVIKNFVCETTKLCNATVLIKSDGTEIGTASAPVRVDPTGTTAQPVTQSGAWNARMQDGSGNAITSATRGSERPLSVQILDSSGNQVTAFGGAGGTASNFSSAFPTPGTAVGFSDGTNMVPGRVISSGADAVANATPWFVTGAFGYVYNGTTWDRLRGDTASGAWVNVKNANIAVTQSGTWTVQPGNTPNTTPWLFAGNVANNADAVSTASANIGSVAYGYGFNGVTWDRLQVDGSKNLKINCAAGCSAAADTTASLSGMTSNGAATQIVLSGTNSVSVLLSGTWAATITPEVSTDGGTTWVATRFYNVNTHTPSNTVTTNGTYDIVGTGGKSHARVRITSYTSGTVTGNLRATSQAPSANDAQIELNSIAQTGAGSIGSTAPGTATLNGCKAVNAEDSAVTAGQLKNCVTDLVGKLINLPYSNPENTLNGTITTAMTGTADTAVNGMGTQGAGVRNYITGCMVSNAHATVGTDVVLKDGSGGTVLWTFPAAPAYGGAMMQFPTPLKTTANTGLYAANITTGSSTKLSCTGYKGA